MDFQNYVNTFFSPTCVVSVTQSEDGGCGDVRIIAGNDKYIRMIDARMQNKEPDKVKAGESAFVPGALYTDYFPVNRSFEDICFRAAVQKSEIHTHAYLSNLDLWFDIYAMPIDYEEDGAYYCCYIAKADSNADAILDTLNSAQTSNDVLKTCIKLHKADNLEEALKNVISDIRKLCDAAGCTVLLIDDIKKDYSVLATDFRPDANLKRVTQFVNFYDIASSWKEMLGDELDSIIISNEEDMEYVSKVNNPWYLTLVEAGVDSVVLFPLRQGDELLGFIWATNFDTDKTMQIKETLELTTFFVSSHIARYKVLDRLHTMSYTDALTGLPNRFACTEHIEELIKANEKFTVVSINLNNFKSINDTLGFESGNHVLIELAKRWRSLSDNYFTRISGDEFMLVVRGYSDDAELKSIISRYVDMLRESLTVDECDLYISASFGYAEFPTDADTEDALISHANAAMNEIKKASSSNHVMHFTPDILRDEHILEVENKIRTALKNDNIYFNLQPQYDMEHKLRGFEALARMKDDAGNVISPGEFIPVAEKVGLIDRVDGMVFKKASAFFGDLLKKTGADLTLSINASVRHMMKNDFLDEIRTLLDTSGIPADHLEIEITESIMIDSADKALQCSDELKSMGIQIAIDDFGTGYSSLSYLNKFPANLLKVDKSFIDTMNTSDNARQYVAAIISIGHVMGFDVISEGVEDPAQIETLKDIGCDYVQGFFWGKPLSKEDSEKLVTELYK